VAVVLVGNTEIFIFIISFMLCFNAFVGYYAVTTASSVDLTAPTLPSDPNILDYIMIAVDYVVFMFGIVGYTIANIPVIFTVFIAVMNATLVYILVSMIRGN
jgi:hypothetical protein